MYFPEDIWNYIKKFALKSSEMITYDNFVDSFKEDMSLINLFLIFKYFKKINITILTDHFTISCMEGEKEIDSFENQLVSLIPENRAIVSSRGLQFELDKTTITIDGKNVSNRSRKDIFNIVSSKKLLVFQSHK